MVYEKLKKRYEESLSNCPRATEEIRNAYSEMHSAFERYMEAIQESSWIYGYQCGDKKELFFSIAMDLKAMSEEELKELDETWQQEIEKRDISESCKQFTRKIIDLMLVEKQEEKVPWYLKK